MNHINVSTIHQPYTKILIIMSKLIYLKDFELQNFHFNIRFPNFYSNFDSKNCPYLILDFKINQNFELRNFIFNHIPKRIHQKISIHNN